MKTINPWMVVLSQFLAVEPFVIIGASLDEVDLEFYLAHRSQLSSRPDKGPSILVEPFPDAVTQSDCAKYGLVLFRGTATDFWAYLEQQIPIRPTPSELVPTDLHNLFPVGTPKHVVVSFSADFELVPANPKANEAPSRFLFGHPPSWEDLAGNLDIAREFTPNIIEDIEKRFGEEDRVLVLNDDIGVGKTTLLRRVGFEFAQKSIVVLICSALSRLDSARTADAIDAIDQPILIIVDNFADQATAITSLISSIEKKDVVILGAERRYRQAYITKALSKVSAKLVHGLELRFIEAERLLRSYLKLGMVGRAEATKNPNHFARQIFRDPIAVAACRILNDFRPLDRIIKSINADTSSEDRRRYLMAALAQLCFRGGVRHEVLAAAAGYTDWREQFETRHPMPLAYFDRERNFVVPLNSTLATRVIELAATTEPELIFDCFVSLAKSIAPRVNRNAIRRRSPEARLAVGCLTTIQS